MSSIVDKDCSNSAHKLKKVLLVTNYRVAQFNDAIHGRFVPNRYSTFHAIAKYTNSGGQSPSPPLP